MSAATAIGVGVVLVVLNRQPVFLTAADVGVLVLLSYLLPYLVVTLVAFNTVTTEQMRVWAARERRGTVLQRYVFGTAPGPGGSIFIAAAALIVAVLWLPGHLGSAFPSLPRVVTALALVVIAWVCVLVSFAVTFQADNVMEREQALDFPGDEETGWSDYVYFAVSVMTTFGTTDVDVVSREMRRTVAANGVIAFVFNTVTVASLVSAVSGV